MLLVVGFITFPVLAATAQWGSNAQINGGKCQFSLSKLGQEVKTWKIAPGC
jgi:hypothetical protein